MVRLCEYEKTEEPYVYEKDYYTYYEDKDRYILDAGQDFYVEPNTDEYNEDEVDIEKEVYDMKSQIDADVAAGFYKGLWVHKLCVWVDNIITHIPSNDWYVPDDYEMSSSLNRSGTNYESEFIEPSKYEEHDFSSDYFDDIEY